MSYSVADLVDALEGGDDLFVVRNHNDRSLEALCHIVEDPDHGQRPCDWPFYGRHYPLAIGGLSYGFTFGALATDSFGTFSNIRRLSDANGVYAAAGAGAAVGPGGGAILLTNQNGAVLALSAQVGLIVAVDLNGLVISSP